MKYKLVFYQIFKPPLAKHQNYAQYIKQLLNKLIFVYILSNFEL